MTEDRKQKALPSDLYTEEYFLSACEGYEEFLESEGQALSRRLRDAFAVAEVEPGMRLLDVGTGRGEIIRHCMRLGAEAHGIDYAEVATRIAREVIAEEHKLAGDAFTPAGVYRSDAKLLPFPSKHFDRVVMFDVVEHLHPWELHEALLEVHRVMKDDGRFVVHTAPNLWYDKYAYPVVRTVQKILGQEGNYPKDPRAVTPVNLHVHVNEQDPLSMRRVLKAAGFKSKVWLDSGPQNRQESAFKATLRRIAFDVPPFRWLFEREVFAVAHKSNSRS